MKILGRIIVGCLLLLGIINCLGIYAQEKTYAVLNSEDYNRILDKLFPREVLNKSGGGFVLVLRYKPSFDAESQIVITGREGEINVVEFTSADGNVYSKLAEVMEQTGQISSVELAKYIRVKKREMKIPLRQLNIWRRNLIESLSRALKPKIQESILPPVANMSVTDDGTSYELWDSSLSGVIYFTSSGIEAKGHDFSGKHSFIRWMEKIKRELDKRK